MLPEIQQIHHISPEFPPKVKPDKMSSSLIQNGGLPGIVFGLGQHQQWIKDDVLLPRNDQNLPELASASSKHNNSIQTGPRNRILIRFQVQTIRGRNFVGKCSKIFLF